MRLFPQAPVSSRFTFVIARYMLDSEIKELLLMSKFKVEVELQGYKVELGSVRFSVEGTKDDVPAVTQQIEKQLSGLLHPPTVMAPPTVTGNSKPQPPVIEGEMETNNELRRKKGKRTAGSGTKTSSDEISLPGLSPATHGSPTQSWTTAQKAIWFLYIVGQLTNVKQLAASSIANNFNKHFRSSGPIDRRNVGRDLEKERLKGTDAPVGADTNSGAAKYFLTQTGESLAQKLIKGEGVAAAA
jgi:hypothetical protein